MTVLPAPRRVDTGGPRKEPQKGMRSVSVNKAMGNRIAAAAKKHGCSMADLVRTACADILEMPLIEVSDETFTRMQRAAAGRGCTVLTIFYEACADIFAPEQPR